MAKYESTMALIMKLSTCEEELKPNQFHRDQQSARTWDYYNLYVLRGLMVLFYDLVYLGMHNDNKSKGPSNTRRIPRGPATGCDKVMGTITRHEELEEA